jgi:hypothetical protein
MNPVDDTPNSLKVLGYHDFIVAGLAQTLRDRFDEHHITIQDFWLGKDRNHMVVLPPHFTKEQLERVRLFTEGYLAAVTWYQR